MRANELKETLEVFCLAKQLNQARYEKFVAMNEKQIAEAWQALEEMEKQGTVTMEDLMFKNVLALFAE